MELNEPTACDATHTLTISVQAADKFSWWYLRRERRRSMEGILGGAQCALQQRREKVRSWGHSSSHFCVVCARYELVYGALQTHQLMWVRKQQL
ncbi:hypothetical protein Q4I30_007088 [Leishmania utingensis]|uniref:Uncharacterized protein n=1 Tax=Leishmania utingensis TaxID=653362 RepID=A0AAW3A0P5_9TRYP